MWRLGLACPADGGGPDITYYNFISGRGQQSPANGGGPNPHEKFSILSSQLQGGLSFSFCLRWYLIPSIKRGGFFPWQWEKDGVCRIRECYLSPNALKTLSGVIGKSLILTPIASYTALAIAAAVGIVGGSPIPIAPNGAVDSSCSSTTQLMFG